MAMKSLGVPASGSSDLTDLGDVDALIAALPRRIYTPPSGEWSYPQHAVGSANATALTAGNNNQLLTFMPFDVGPNALALQAVGIGVSAAQSGGSTTAQIAIYADDGSGGLPNCVPGPAFGPVTLAALTSTGNRTASVSWTLQPGRYWIAFLYTETTAPTTRATVYTVGNTCPSLPIGSTTTIGTANGRCWQLAGQTSFPTGSQPTLTINAGNLGVLTAVQAA